MHAPQRLILWAVALIASAATADAQSDDVRGYPSRPIHIVVPASAGGANDVLARLVGQKMAETFGQPVVVDNKPGAQTILGTEYVARATPNGYTLLAGPMASMAVNPAVYAKLSYSPQRDFVPVSLVASYPLILAINKGAPIRTVRDLAAYAKANPSKVNAGGSSATFQLATELFKQRTGAPIEYIPYKGSNDSVASVIAGETLMAIVDAGPVAAQLKSDQVRGLAVTAPTRMASFPDLPTMAEAGVGDMVVLSWSGIFAPAGTPAPIVAKLQDEIMRVVKLPDIRARLGALELDPVGSTSDEFRRIIAGDIDRWTRVAKTANITLEP
ncbi:MAG TPA: tripartite tricarboxylate transporter substrate binding protein [Alphaproteobacteria bacterium]